MSPLGVGLTCTTEYPCESRLTSPDRCEPDTNQHGTLRSPERVGGITVFGEMSFCKWQTDFYRLDSEKKSDILFRDLSPVAVFRVSEHYRGWDGPSLEG